MTHYFYLDASAFVKRYTDETGSDMVHYLVENVLSLCPACLLISWLGLLEIVAVLNRHRNDGRLTERLFQQAMVRLSDEAAQMHFLSMTDDIAAQALSLVLRYNLNASDALYLQQVLDWHSVHNAQDEAIVLVAADERLLRAARDEGVDTLSPGTDPMGRVVRLLSN